MIIFINPSASGGRALKKWENIRSFIAMRFNPDRIVVLDEGNSMKKYVVQFINQGFYEFVAAGGDGTVNTLLQCIMNSVAPTRIKDFKIGAIGLGSSNDFHKPFNPKNSFKNISCLLDFNSSELRDVAVLSYLDDDGLINKKYWLINASIGITAQANLFFNHPDFILQNLKKSLTNSAILYTTLRTILGYKNRNLSLKIGNHEWHPVNLTNMGVVKSPHFSGNFAYDTPFEKNNGRFYINISQNMRLLKILNLLWNLSQHRFKGLMNTEIKHSDCLKVSSDQAFAIEFDGEVICTKFAEFNIIKNKIGVCTC
jgi:diacylglycerol kinase (ATP)